LSQQVEVELFGGREGGNNESILGLLIQNKLTAYQIAKRLGKAYSTIFDRLDDLEKRGIIEEKGKTDAAKTHSKIQLWGLSPYGLYVAALQCVNQEIRVFALNECQRTLLAAWGVFWKLYEFDLVTDRTFRHRYIRNWVASDEGIIEFLRTFGHTPLQGEAQALIAFRRMLDIGIILVESEGDFALTKLGNSQQSTNFAQTLTFLAGIANDHPKLRKLHEAMREVDGPLYSRIKSEAFEQAVLQLSKSVPIAVARKLTITPLFRNYPLALMDMTKSHIVDSSLDQVVSSAVSSVKHAVEQNRRTHRAKRSTKNKSSLIQVDYHPSIQQVVLEPGGLNIVTNDPDAISKEWLRSSDIVIVIDQYGHVKTRKGAEWRKTN
jgi:hypothetical protein